MPSPLDLQTAADLQVLANGGAPPVADLPIGGNAGLPPNTPQPVGPVASYAPQAPAPMASVDPMVSQNAAPGALAFAPGSPEGQPAAPVAPPPKPVVIPGGWQPTSRNTQMQSGVQYSQPTLDALRAMTQAGNRVDQDQAAALEAQQKEAQKVAQANAAQADADMAEFNARKAAQANAKAAAMGKVQTAQNAFDLAQSKGVDPNHWWAEKSTGSKIAMAIGAMAGGWLVGTGATGQNPMLEQINKSIDRDIQAQRENIAGKGRNLDNAMSMYSLARQSGLDEDSAADAAKLLAHQQLDAHLKAQLPEAQNALGKLQLDKAIQENQAKIAQLRAGIEEKASDKTAVSGSESFRQPQTIGGPQQILALAGKIHGEKWGQPGNSWDAAVREATLRVTGKDINPGAPEPIIGAPKGGAGAGRALARGMVANKANDADLARLQQLAGKTFLSPAEQQESKTLIANLKANHVELPGLENSTILSRLFGTSEAAVQAARSSQQNRLKAAQDVAASGLGAGGGGGGEGEPEEEPEGFEGD